MQAVAPVDAPNRQAVATENFYYNIVTGVTKLISAGMIFSSPDVTENSAWLGNTGESLFAFMPYS